ncbi:MAG: cytochrome o ubiquinol oxidase subunit III [Gammaproteobacteria bacterium]
MMPDLSTPYPNHAQPEDESISESTRVFGFWVYLMSDAVIFALLFATYASMSRNVAGGPGGKELFDLGNAFYETLLLLFSTLTCGLAMLCLSKNKMEALLPWLALTFILGFGFVLMELSEFVSLIQQGAGPSRSGFLSAFFTLVGAHGLHVSIGLVWLLVMIHQIEYKGLTAPVRSRLYRFSLFWHFLDLVWVAIFSVVYLLGVL